MSLGFTVPKADASAYLPVKSALRDWQLGWQVPTRKSSTRAAGSRDPCLQPQGYQDPQLI